MRFIATMLLVGVAGSVWAAAPAVRFGDGRLSAQLSGADLIDVVREVQRETGIEVRGMPSQPQPVSVALEAVPLEAALERLLAGQSFALRYGEGGRLRGVTFLGSARAEAWVPLGPPAAGASDESIGPPYVDPGESPGLVASHRPVPIRGRLARAMGTAAASFSSILGVALQDPDPRVRADALRVALRIVDAEPDLHGDLLSSLSMMDDAVLAGWLKTVAGEHALDVARRAVRGVRSAGLRGRLEGIVRQLTIGT